jgi:integrative and conjugative element protein (TIGR02256 family)
VPEGYVEFGELIEGLNPDTLTLPLAQRMFHAVARHPAFKLLELRRTTKDPSELLIVECRNDKVWSKNPVGIQYRERLALRFFSDPKRLPEVRALRENFPATAHQNHVLRGEPIALCLYLEQWPALERYWTPEKHLNRILFWLTETSNGTLHLEDQPVEQIYFKGYYELVIPPDFDEKAGDKHFLLKAEPRLQGGEKKMQVLVSEFVPAARAKLDDFPFACVSLKLKPIVHGGVERTPYLLGDLHDQLERRGAPLSPILFDYIKDTVGEAGVGVTKEKHTLLILQIPILRKAEEDPERIEARGFIVHAGLGMLGVAGGALVEINGRFQRFQLMGEAEDKDDWRDFNIEPIECLPPFTRKLARATSGITSEGPKGVLAGVGALGSALANIWCREGWGFWSYIDSDHLKPHNLSRHAAFEPMVGSYKVHAVESLCHTLYGPQEEFGKAIVADAGDFQNAVVGEVIRTSELIVDATTTFEYPRDLSVHSKVKRAASVFLTPSGQDSVLLMEDTDRSIRLDVLEAQYYRAILNNEWGTKHLAGNYGHLRVGGGCRDVTSVMSPELINVNAATLARQVRLKSEKPDAAICVWHCDPETGEVVAQIIEVATPVFGSMGPWTIVIDGGVLARMRELRKAALPNETGGVLLGYFDMKLLRLYVVDSLPAPSDSKEERTGYIRGAEGVVEAVNAAQARTANIVSYIGEWHSHPPRASTHPSSDDVRLLNYLASNLQHDGLPALMLIVGDTEMSFLMKDMT